MALLDGEREPRDGRPGDQPNIDVNWVREERARHVLVNGRRVALRQNRHRMVGGNAGSLLRDGKERATRGGDNAASEVGAIARVCCAHSELNPADDLDGADIVDVDGTYCRHLRRPQSLLRTADQLVEGEQGQDRPASWASSHIESGPTRGTVGRGSREAGYVPTLGASGGDQIRAESVCTRSASSSIEHEALPCSDRGRDVRSEPCGADNRCKADS